VDAAVLQLVPVEIDARVAAEGAELAFKVPDVQREGAAAAATGVAVDEDEVDDGVGGDVVVLQARAVLQHFGFVAHQQLVLDGDAVRVVDLVLHVDHTRPLLHLYRVKRLGQILKGQLH